MDCKCRCMFSYRVILFSLHDYIVEQILGSQFAACCNLIVKIEKQKIKYWGILKMYGLNSNSQLPPCFFLIVQLFLKKHQYNSRRKLNIMTHRHNLEFYQRKHDYLGNKLLQNLGLSHNIKI